MIRAYKNKLVSLWIRPAIKKPGYFVSEATWNRGGVAWSIAHKPSKSHVFCPGAMTLQGLIKQLDLLGVAEVPGGPFFGGYIYSSMRLMHPKKEGISWTTTPSCFRCELLVLGEGRFFTKPPIFWGVRGPIPPQLSFSKGFLFSFTVRRKGETDLILSIISRQSMIECGCDPIPVTVTSRWLLHFLVRGSPFKNATVPERGARHPRYKTTVWLGWKCPPSIHKDRQGVARTKNWMSASWVATPRKINMEPENTPLEEENHLPNHHVQVLYQSSGVHPAQGRRKHIPPKENHRLKSAG